MMADEEDVVAAKSQHLEISDDESISFVEMFVRFTPVTECILEHLPNPCALMRTCKDVHHMVMNYIPLALVRKRARVIHTPQGRGFSLSSAPPIFRVDKDLAMMAVYRHALDYALLDPYLQNDFSVVKIALVSAMLLASIRVDKLVTYIPQSIHESSAYEDFVECACERWPSRGRNDKYDFTSLIIAFPSDKDICLFCVKQHGDALQCAVEQLKNDREIVLAAVKQDGNALKFASEQLKNDREIVLAAVKQNGYLLQCASKQLKNDREIVLAAVKQNEYALQYANEQLKNDREIVLVAVKQNRYALRYASQQLKNDRKIVLAAVKQDGNSLEYANEQLKNDREMVLAAIKEDVNALQFASEQLQNDREIVLAAVKQDGNALQYASQQLQNDQEILLAMEILLM